MSAETPQPEPPPFDGAPVIYECPECGIKDYGNGRMTVPLKRYLFMDHCPTCDERAAEAMRALGRRMAEEREAKFLEIFTKGTGDAGQQ